MDKDLRYRSICPICNRAFNSKFGNIVDGKLVCLLCSRKYKRYDEYLPLGDDEESSMMIDIDYDSESNEEEYKKQQYPEFVPKDWRDCYKLPLHLDKYCVYALDANDGTALSSFNLKYDEIGNYLPGEQERIKHIIDVINGDCVSDFKPEWKLSDDEPCKITYKGEYQFLVRGWGYLTGCGGLNLPEELAAKMQDGFIEYILDKLNGKTYGTI